MGCATWNKPELFDESVLRNRSVTKAEEGVTLNASVLSTDDSKQLFGVDVNGKGIQPVWIEIDNQSKQTLWLLRSGTDPDYFSPLEVAWSFHSPFSGSANAAMDKYFDSLSFVNPIPSGETRRGILFTNRHPRAKILNVDLLGQRNLIPLTLFLPVPDDNPDYEDLQNLVRKMASENIDIENMIDLRSGLEDMPCCATVSGEAAGDPMNVVLIGPLDDIAAALVRRGYRRVSTPDDDRQKLFDRSPDVVARKSAQGGAPANWLRFWAAPIRYQGQPVFLAQAGRPVGGRFFNPETQELALHPDVDEARNLLIQDLLYSGGLQKLGFLKGAGMPDSFTRGESNVNSPYVTDGLRAVFFLATRPLSLSDVEILDWVPYLEEQASGAPEQAERQ